MRFIKTKEKGLSENYLELHYDKLDDETKEYISRLDNTLSNIEGTLDDRRISLPVTDVMYFESVDRKTFAYTEKVCVEMRDTLKNLLDNYSEMGFIRISKSSIVKCI